MAASWPDLPMISMRRAFGDHAWGGGVAWKAVHVAQSRLEEREANALAAAAAGPCWSQAKLVRAGLAETDA